MRKFHKSKPPKKNPKQPFSFKAKFPRIYRFFTDLRTYVWITSFFLLVAVGFAISDLTNTFKQKQELEARLEGLRNDLSRWEELSRQYPDSRDVYFKLAVLEYQLGEKQKSKEYLQKSLELDPNFKEGREFEERLTEK